MHLKRAAPVAIAIAMVAAGACSKGPTAPTPPVTVAPVPVPPPTTVVNNPPTVACPGPLQIVSPTNGPATVSFSVPASEGGQAPVRVSCSPAPGTAFPIGTTSVECVATDALNRAGSCAFSVTVLAPAQLRRTRFMAFGDSTTAGEITVPTGGLTPQGFPSSTLIQVPAASYPSVLKGLMTARYPSQSETIALVNLGLGAEKAEFALPRFIAALDGFRPDVVLLMEGYNDICCGNGSVGLRVMETGISAMAAEARHRGARVFIATLAPATFGDRFINEEQKDAANARLRAIAQSEGAYLVDIFAALLPDVRANIGIDGMHPTEIGYRRIAEAFFAAIQADLEIR